MFIIDIILYILICLFGSFLVGYLTAISFVHGNLVFRLLDYDWFIYMCWLLVFIPIIAYGLLKLLLAMGLVGLSFIGIYITLCIIFMCFIKE